MHLNKFIINIAISHLQIVKLMKKRVEADLISIAHRILKLKNKSDVAILQTEIKKLYDAITILKFYNDNFDQVNATVSENDLNLKLENFFNDDNTDPLLQTTSLDNNEYESTLPEVQMNDTATESNSDTTAPDLDESTDVLFEPLFEIASTPLFEPVKSSPREISFEELLGKNYGDSDFVKPAELELQRKQQFVEKTTYGLSISLNDRIGFEQQLFGGSSEDFNRVLSQLNTFDNYAEAKDFIEEIVKPDYDFWKDKDDFANRFMELVENKFK